MAISRSRSRDSPKRPSANDLAMDRHWSVVTDRASSPVVTASAANAMVALGAAIEVPLTRVLGRGENGVTFETNDRRAVKIIRYNTPGERAQLRNETAYQKELAALEIAPAVHADELVSNYSFILMDKVEPINVSTASQPFIRKLVKLIAKMVYYGYVHNDVHRGNVARCVTTREPILIDFGFTQKLGYIPDRICFNQILMAQLYALMDACNVNNCVSGDCAERLCQKEEPIATIYQLRQGQTYIYDQLASPAPPTPSRQRRGATIREPARFTRHQKARHQKAHHPKAHRTHHQKAHRTHRRAHPRKLISLVSGPALGTRS